MGSSVNHLLTGLRAACRQRLITLPRPSIAVTGSISARSIISSTNQFTNADLVAGEYISINNNQALTTKIEAGKITVKEDLPNATLTNANLELQKLEYAWQGETYIPKIGTPFVQEVLKSLNQQVKGIGGVTEHLFLYIMTLQFPAGEGTQGIERMAERIFDWFKPGAGIASIGEHGSLICETKLDSILQDTAWISLPISAKIRAWSE